MKKLFSLFAAAIVALAMNATTVTFDFTDTANWTAWGFTLPAAGAGTDLDGQSIVSNGVTLSFAKGTGNTTVRIYQGSGNNEGKYDLRLYAGDVLTVSVSGTDLINAISFNAAVSEVGGESKTSFTYAAGVTSAQFSSKAPIKNMTVTLNETVTEWTPDTVGVTAAKALIDASDNHDHYVFGRVMKAPFAVNGTHAAWIADLNNPTDSLELYTFKHTASAAWTDAELAEAILPGDTILVHAASLSKYNTIYETTSCYFVGYLGQAPRAQTNELVYTSVTFSLAAGAADFVLTNGDAATALSLTTTTTSNTPAGVYSLNAQTASFGTADIEEGTLSVSFDHVANGEYFYAFKAAFTVAGVAYKSNDVLKVAGSYPEDITNIDAATAAEIAGTLASGANTDVTYDIYAYVSSEPTTNKSGNQVFYIADDATSTLQVFYCYGVTWTGNAPKIHDMVHVKAQLKNYNGTLETNYGNGEVVTEFPELMRHGTTAEIITVSADRAYQIGNDLVGEALTTVSTEKTYRIIGYVAKIKTAYDESYKNQTFFLCNSDTATYGQLQVYRGKSDVALELHDKIVIEGKISKYTYEDGGASVQVSNPTCTLTTEDVPDDAQAIENLYQGLKATKALRNGQVVILKAGQAFNLLGTRL